MTHAMLVRIAYNWVLKNAACGVAFREFKTYACNNEYPDVIGFGSGCHSVLVECKASRSDFFADKKKHFRQTPELGMGTQRFYCCPAGLIKREELPEGWGLIEVSEKAKARASVNPWAGDWKDRHIGHPKNIKAEHELMYSALRRLAIRGRIEEVYDPKDKTTPAELLQGNQGGLFS